jgi:hypothetical protein
VFEVFHDAGRQGRILVADSLTHFAASTTTSDVVLGASFAGVPTVAVPLACGIKGWIAHEAGPGKSGAGVSGLAASQHEGIPAAAIATMSARLSDGRSLLGGRIAVANEAAAALGVRVGQTGAEAARLMLAASLGHRVDLSALVDDALHEMLAPAEPVRGGIYAVWSFLQVQRPMPLDVICVASHGGRVMAEYALRLARPRGVIANDAGMGLDASGIDGLPVLERAGIAAAAVSTDSACIGNALSTYRDGVISAVNSIAAGRGVHVGMKASDAAGRLLTPLEGRGA